MVFKNWVCLKWIQLSSVRIVEGKKFKASARIFIRVQGQLGKLVDRFGPSLLIPYPLNDCSGFSAKQRKEWRSDHLIYLEDRGNILNQRKGEFPDFVALS